MADPVRPLGENASPSHAEDWRTSRGRARWALGIIFVLSLAPALWAANAAKLLRPAADDYCIGVRGALGPIGGFVQDWNSWSGFATPSFVTNLLLGVPLAELPVGAGSAIPFIAAVVSVGLLAAAVFSTCRRSVIKYRWITVSAATVFGGIAWWAYLWVPTAIGGDHADLQLAMGLTHWQNLNTAYIVPQALILAGLLVVGQGRFPSGRAKSVLVGVLGVLAGFSGPAFALGVILASICLAAISWFTDSAHDHRRVWSFVVLGVSASVALAVSFMAPGSRVRSSVVEAQSGLALPRPNDLITMIFPDTIVTWLDAYISGGAVVVVVLATCVTWLAVKSGLSLDRSRALLSVLTFGVLSFTLAVSVRVTDGLAYPGYWHNAPVRLTAFATLVAIGTWAGARLSEVTHTWPGVLVAVGLILSLGTTMAATLDMSTSISNRQAQWALGPAPMGDAVQDTETPWIDGCWEQLSSQRSLPVRRP